MENSYASELEKSAAILERAETLLSGMTWSRSPSDGEALCLGQMHFVLELHSAFVSLLRGQMYGAAAALIRTHYEAYVRGSWLHLNATDSEIRKFREGKSPPPISTLLSRLEPKYDGESDSGPLSAMKEDAWDALCSYSHSGWHQVSTRIHGDGIGNRPNLGGFCKVLHNAGVMSLGALKHIGHIVERDDLLSEANAMTEEYFGGGAGGGT